MIEFRFSPLLAWPYPGTTRRKSAARFQAAWSTTRAELDHELRQLKAVEVLLCTGHVDPPLRRDGMPLSRGPQPVHPGVQISFDSSHGPLVYGTDVYDEWKANVRAIVLSLEALRSVDRHGVTRRGEQYAGWRQLSADLSTQTMNGLTHSWAIDLVNEHCTFHASDVPLGDRTSEGLARCFKSARAATHPDRSGDSADFLRLEQAGRVLGLLT